MNRLFSLSNVMFKISLSSFKVSKKKSLNILFMIFMFFSLVVPAFFLLNFLFKSLLESLVPLNQEGVLVNVLLDGLSIVILFFSFLQIPYVYYFSNDIETYLALPIKPYEILLSRLFVILIYEYLFVLMIFIPFMISYVQITGNIISILYALIVALLIPVGPILVSSLIVILLMNFVPVFKNKNAINLIFGGLAFAFGIGINVLVQGRNFEGIDMMDLLQQGNNSLSGVMKFVFPNIPFASRAITNNSIIDLLIFIAITIGLLALYLLFAQTFYLNGATTISDRARSKKRFSSDQLTTKSDGSITKAFLIRDAKTLLRSPVYLLNGVLPIFMFPIMIALIPLFNGLANDNELMQFIPMIQQWLNNNEIGLPLALSVGMIIGFLTSSMNMLSVTSLTREAKVLGHLKAYPIDHFKIMLGKLILNLGLTFLGVLLTLFSINIWIPLPLKFNLLVIVSSIISMVFANVLMMLIDLWRPNLKWTNEIQAMKQSVNNFINIFGLWAIIGVLVYILYLLRDVLFYATIGVNILLLIASLALLYFMKVNAQDLILRTEV